MQEAQETQVQSLGQEDALEEETATHSSILVWRIPWREEPGGLQSMGLQSWMQLKQLSTHRKALSLNTVTFRVGASTYEFDSLQFIASRQTKGVL